MVDVNYDEGFDNDIPSNTAGSLLSQAITWANADPDRHLNRFTYDGRNDRASLAVTVEDQADLQTAIGEIDQLITQLNTQQNAGAPPPDETNVNISETVA